MLTLDDISKKDLGSFSLKTLSGNILENLKLGIVGETGSGKSTLLKIIAGLEQSDTGKVFFREEELLGPMDQLIAGHPEIAYLSQHFELPKFITVSTFLQRNLEITQDELHEICIACDIDHLLENDTRALSGGEKQRVALAKAISKSPSLLLLDEPFSNLDQNHKRAIKNTIEELHQDWVSSIILVSHDPIDVLSWADQIWVFKEGELVQTDTPKKLYDEPKNEYVAGLFGPYNLLNRSALLESNTAHFHTINEQLFIRPEKVKICNSSLGQVMKVLKIDFKGSFDEVTGQLGAHKILLISDTHQLKIGDEVSICFR